jgi:homoserine O-acetyltransferase
MTFPAAHPADGLSTGLFESGAPFTLECGAVLPSLRLAYETWGEPNASAGGAVLVVHALTGDAHAASGGSSGDPRPGWWEGLVGEGRALDPTRRFVVCANLIGSCYGSSGPRSADPRTGRPFGALFPAVTTRDMARATKLLLDSLEVGRLDLVLGGSLGAMVAWELAAEFPELARTVVPVAGGPCASAWAIAFNAVARRAIEADPEWRGGGYEGQGPVRGLAQARRIAMISYRTARLFEERFGRERIGGREGSSGLRFQVESYLDHQGEKLARRFDARSYVALSRAMDVHDLGRGRGSLREALGRIRSEVVAVGIDSDVLFPAAQIREAADGLARAGGSVRYEEIRSGFGHDAFLVEIAQLSSLVASVLEEGGRP